MKKKEVKTERKVLSTKTYTVKIENFDDGTNAMHRINDGFNPLELLGLTDFISMEIREQISGRIKPDVIKRDVIV